MASFPNIYAHRKVAATAAKSCEICFKPSTSVLLARGNKDFFYVCDVHLKDQGFCRPLLEQDSASVESRKLLDGEIKRLKKEYEDKKEKNKYKLDKGSDLGNPCKEKDSGKEKELEHLDKAKNIPDTNINSGPKEFVLFNTFYQNRLHRKRNAEIIKHNIERLRNPNLFPKIPKDLP